MSETRAIEVEQLVKLMQTLSASEKEEFLADVTKLLQLNEAYLDKAKSLGILHDK